MKKKFINLLLLCVLILFSSIKGIAQNIFPTCVGCNVGIGTLTPSYSLDVDQGDINLSDMAKTYRIGGSAGTPSYPVLWNFGNHTNIFVGFQCECVVRCGSTHSH